MVKQQYFQQLGVHSQKLVDTKKLVNSLRGVIAWKGYDGKEAWSNIVQIGIMEFMKKPSGVKLFKDFTKFKHISLIVEKMYFVEEENTRSIKTKGQQKAHKVVITFYKHPNICSGLFV